MEQAYLISVSGSSPRVRGTLVSDTKVKRVVGIIPACAGNTSQLSTYAMSTWDHPRVCGEHAIASVYDESIPGSSPRVRGTLCRPSRYRPDPGIIPACAGNTLSSRTWRRRTRDHPRVCGEHSTPKRLCVCDSGSSPRVRGTLHAEKALRVRHGIIPACAGNTIVENVVEELSRDHPRVCGEHR